MLARDFFRIPNANKPKKQSVESQLYNVRVLEFRNGTTSNAAGEAAKGYIMRPDGVSMNRPLSLGHEDAFLLIVNQHYCETVMLMVSQSLPSSTDIHQQHCGSYTREYQQSLEGTYEN